MTDQTQDINMPDATTTTTNGSTFRINTNIATNTNSQEPTTQASDFIVHGQEPTPISPVDREPPISFSNFPAPTSRTVDLPLPASTSLSNPIVNPTTSVSPNSDTKRNSTSAASAPSSSTVPESTSLETTTMRAKTPMAELAADEVTIVPKASTTTTTSQTIKQKQVNINDPAVIYNIPSTPSALAYQAAQEKLEAGYFEPEFPNTEAEVNGSS